MKNSTKILLLNILLLFSYSTWGYITAADLYYENLGNHTYRFYLDVYYECDGSIDAQTASTQTLTIESDDLGITVLDGKTIDLTVSKSAVFESVFCTNKQFETNCYGEDLRGLEKVTFTGIKYLGDFITDDLRIHWTKNFRSQNINTSEVEGVPAYYVETIINTKLTNNNNSPLFSNEDPIITACTGEENIIDLLIS